MPENPKVLIFIKGLDIGGYSGGADLFGVNLASELSINRIEVVLCVCCKFNTEAETELIKSLQNKGITPLFLVEGHFPPGINGYFKAFTQLNRYLSNHPIEILHCHFHTGTLISILLKFLGKARWVIRTAHVDKEWSRGWHGILKQFIIRILIFILFPVLVNLEIGVSRSTVNCLNKRIVAKLFNKKAAFIPNAIPVDDDFLLNISQKDYSHWQTDHPIIGSVGRLEEQKGYEFLIGALPEVIRIHPDVEAWLVGDGPLYKEYLALCKTLGVDDHVNFWGKQNKVPELLSKMDVFVSSSVYEGLPTVILEAMLHGVPCVVTDIPGTNDIAQEKNVVLVAVRDGLELARGINLVLENPSLRKTLAESAIQSVNKFSIKKISLEYMDVYREL